jgi:DNA repair protein RAD50
MQVLKRTATDTTRFVAEIKAIDKDIERAENELAVTGSVQTIEDVQKKLEGVSSSINKRNESLRSLAREKDTQRNTIQMLESAISKGNMDLMRARHALKQRQDWEQSKEAARAQIQELENALKAIDAEAKNAAAPIRKLEESLHELRADFDRKERELQKKQEQYDKSLRHLEAARSAIDRCDCLPCHHFPAETLYRYEMSGAGEKLDRTRATLADLNKQMAEIEQAAKSISAAIRQAEKEASETEQVKRNMVDNIKYREQQQKIKTLQDEIEDMNIESAEKAYRKFDTEYEAARQRQAKMQAKQNSLMGEIVSLKKSYADKKQELASEYKDVKSEYRAQLIKVKVRCRPARVAA